MPEAIRYKTLDDHDVIRITMRTYSLKKALEIFLKAYSGLGKKQRIPLGRIRIVHKTLDSTEEARPLFEDVKTLRDAIKRFESISFNGTVASVEVVKSNPHYVITIEIGDEDDDAVLE